MTPGGLKTSCPGTRTSYHLFKWALSKHSDRRQEKAHRKISQQTSLSYVMMLDSHLIWQAELFPRDLGNIPGIFQGSISVSSRTLVHALALCTDPAVCPPSWSQTCAEVRAPTAGFMAKIAVAHITAELANRAANFSWAVINMEKRGKQKKKKGWGEKKDEKGKEGEEKRRH